MLMRMLSRYTHDHCWPSLSSPLFFVFILWLCYYYNRDITVASSEYRLCAQFVPSHVKRRKRLQLQEFHRRKRLVCLEQRQLHIHWFDAFWAHASEVPMHEWTGSNWSWTSGSDSQWTWAWGPQNGTGIGTSTKLKVQQHKLMTSVVGDTIGRLQNELQKFLDYSYRYSLFNSYSFRGNYILGYSTDGHKVISSRCLLPV